jgi:hypothetical protein
MYAPGQLLFKDTNPAGGIIDGVLNWTGSMNESQVKGYRVYYRTKNASNIYHHLGVVEKRADKAYQFTLPTLPTDVAEIGVVVNNSIGEEPGSWPIVSMYDNRLSDPLTSVSTTSNLPVPRISEGQLFYPQAGKIGGWLRWEVSSNSNILLQLAGQTIYFTDTYGTKLQLIGTALEPRIENNNIMNYNGLNISEPITIPNGATQIAIYSVLDNGKENDIPAYYPLPPTIQFTDWDEHYRSIRGHITWNQDNDESNIKAYYAYFTGYNVTPVEIGHVPKGEPWRISIPTSITIPQGTNQVQYAIKQKYFTGSTAIDIKQILLTLSNPSNPFSQISKEDTQVLLSLIKPIMSAN